MTRRQSSFARALSDAEKRLDKALAERTAAQAKLAQLQEEIPSLMHVIEALQLKKPDRVVFHNSKTGVETPPKAMTPDELAKWYVDRDLSGLGSIPALTEDITLPDDFEVIPKK